MRHLTPDRDLANMKPFLTPFRAALSAFLILQVLFIFFGGGGNQLQAQTKVLDWGDILVHQKCLLISLVRYVDHPNEDHDWVTLNVNNRCGKNILLLGVTLKLVDAAARIYGTTLWVVPKGSAARAGASFTRRYPVPDPQGLRALKWALEVKYLYPLKLYPKTPPKEPAP